MDNINYDLNDLHGVDFDVLRGIDLFLHGWVRKRKVKFLNESVGDHRIVRFWDEEADTEVPSYFFDAGAACELLEALTGVPYGKVKLDGSHYHGWYCAITAPDRTQRDADCPIRRDTTWVWGLTIAHAVARSSWEACRAGGASLETRRKAARGELELENNQ